MKRLSEKQATFGLVVTGIMTCFYKEHFFRSESLLGVTCLYDNVSITVDELLPCCDIS